MVRTVALALLLGSSEAGRFLKSQSKTMEALAPFYHSTDAIHEELSQLAQRCPHMKLDTKQDSGRAIDVVTIRDPSAKVLNKNFLLFGEHARELISPESGLHFVKTLCGETGLSDRAKEVLKESEFQIVVNGNPASRQKVEQGDFCLRVNPDGVDLNRNWDEEWQPDPAMGVDTNPGPAAFSEPETRIFKQLVTDYNPTTFLTIHSGTKGMYMPWAYDMDHLAQRNEPEMMQILKTLDKDYCQCPFGAAGREVGYSCPGTCLDYVYDKLNAQYAFAWEIYTSPSENDELRARWQEKMQDSGPGAFLQLNSSLAHEHFRDLFEAHPSSFVQVRSKTRRSGMSPEECFAIFNPGSEGEFNGVVENWSGAYLDMAAEVVLRLKRSGAAPSTTTTPAGVATTTVSDDATIAAVADDATTTTTTTVDATTTTTTTTPEDETDADKLFNADDGSATKAPKKDEDAHYDDR